MIPKNRVLLLMCRPSGWQHALVQLLGGAGDLAGEFSLGMRRQRLIWRLQAGTWWW